MAQIAEFAPVGVPAGVVLEQVMHRFKAERRLDRFGCFPASDTCQWRAKRDPGHASTLAAECLNSWDARYSRLVTRIISGAAGSLRLSVPKSGTRPTSDRVREAIFSALDAQDALRGATVIDLYAGSGALGLEAASRGAHSVTLVENSPEAARIARQNATQVSSAFSPDARPEIVVTKSSVASFLTSCMLLADLVFVDPPYDLSEDELASNLNSISRVARPDALVIVERSTRSPEPTWPDAFRDVRKKSYGETAVWTATRSA